ncbi:MAG: NADPH:quinone oxidoreductase family protein, partial [Parvibaculaceae bacterium]
MKAVLCEALGSPENLVIADIPAPEPREGEVLVRVKAVGLNFLDTLIIEGRYQVKPPLPFSPGAEMAGEVLRGGKRFRAGDRVMGFFGHGCAREMIAVCEDSLVKIPDALDDARAAGLCITYGTSLHALKDRAQLKPGETLAVLGASGGVGQAAIEIGKAMGARVVACASDDRKLAFCKALGADILVNYTANDLKQALRDVEGGVDVVYDPVGGDFTEAALRALGFGGRLLVVGFAQGGIPKLPLNIVLLKGADILGVYWGEHTKREPELHRANMDQLTAWAASGTIRPHIHKIYALEEIAVALDAIARRE